MRMTARFAALIFGCALSVAAFATSERAPPPKDKQSAHASAQAQAQVKARGAQHVPRVSTAALRTALRTPAKGATARPSPTARQGIARTNPASDTSAPHSTARQLSPPRTGAIVASHPLSGSAPIAASTRRQPAAPVTLGGAVTNRTANRGLLDGNAVHRRF